MKKRIVVFAMCMFLAIGCASWQKMSTSEKLDLAGNYYEVFLTGLKVALPIISTDTKVARALQFADLALKTYENVVEKYKEGTAGADAVVIADSSLYVATVDANKEVGVELAKK